MAQTVLDAFTEDNSLHDWKHNHYNTDALAAALRAVADEVVPPGQDHWLAEWTIRRKLLKIAKELEGGND